MKKYQGIILIHIWNISNLPEVTAVSFHLPTCPYFPWTLNVHQVSSNSSSAEPEKSHVAIVRPFHMHWWRRCPRPHLVSPFEIPWPLGRVAKLFAIASLRVFVLTQQDLPHDIQIYIYISTIPIVPCIHISGTFLNGILLHSNITLEDVISGTSYDQDTSRIWMEKIITGMDAHTLQRSKTFIFKVWQNYQ